MTAIIEQKDLPLNKQGHLLGKIFTEDGYALCAKCGISGKDQRIYGQCPSIPIEFRKLSRQVAK